MGSMTTFRSGLQGTLAYFSWFAPYSAGMNAGPEKEVIEDTDALWAEINSPEMKDYKIHLLLNFNGTADIAHDGHVTTVNRLLEISGDRLVEGENCAFYDYGDFTHSWYAWIIYFYNTTLVFFN